MAEYGSIYIEKGPGGYGGPLVVTPTDQRNKVMYILGEMDKPPCLDRIVELSGMIPVDSYKETVPEDEIALAIVDCGGTLRCGIYPKK
ncbi:MAG: PTS sorbitol transporter subunit IIB, partial [Lachnospiraceae bacterium]|nr:PTS sorbitol transporter subunit IIB [Lachnospiraceae bacterium]